MAVGLRIMDVRYVKVAAVALQIDVHMQAAQLHTEQCTTKEGGNSGRGKAHDLNIHVYADGLQQYRP
jgi:hypothetical protein